MNSVALVGPGAVGLYYGGLLAQSGADLHVLERSDATALREDGIQVRMMEPQAGGLIATHGVTPASVEREAAMIGTVDCVIIAAKATVN